MDGGRTLYCTIRKNFKHSEKRTEVRRFLYEAISIIFRSNLGLKSTGLMLYNSLKIKMKIGHHFRENAGSAANITLEMFCFYLLCVAAAPWVQKEEGTQV